MDTAQKGGASTPQTMKQGLQLNANQLKLIAIVAMTIDHVAWVVFPGYSKAPLALALHLIGRITAPIMCFFIAEGYHYTHDLKRYIARLLLFAIPSHFAYLFAFGHPLLPDGLLNQTSVLWPFGMGLVALAVLNGGWKTPYKLAAVAGICLITFPADWSCIAVLVIIGFAGNRGSFKKMAFSLVFFVACYAVVYIFCLDAVYGALQMGVVLSLPLLYAYNGERGKLRGPIVKWGFYVYYPLHLVLVGLLRLYLN